MSSPSKERFFDSLHGFIHVSPEEKKLLEHPAFNRLHYLHQLGLAYLVYPGATHSRFEHTLGVMHLATKIYDQLFEKTNFFHRQALRLGALCHDLGHLPFSHTAENLLLGEYGHEKKSVELILWLKKEKVFESFEKVYPDLIKLVIKIAVSPHVYNSYFPQDCYTDEELVLASIVSGDYFGSDRIDYLTRDSRSTGLSLGLCDFAQLIEMLAIVPIEQKPVIVLKEEGLLAAEGLLMARHYMQQRVYKYPAVLSYNEALKQFLVKTNLLDFKNMGPAKYIHYTDAWLTQEFLQASYSPSSPGFLEALILTKKGEKQPAVKFIRSKQTALIPLIVLKKNQTLESLVPVDIDKGLFSQI